MNFTKFWQEQKGAIYFGIFLLMCLSLILYSQSKNPEKVRNLVEFSLDLVDKMEKENLELVEFSKNFGQSGATNSFSVSSSLQQSFQINEQISGQSLVSQGKTEGIEPTREIKVEDFDILITKIETSQAQFNQVAWPESLGQDTIVLQKTGQKMLEIHKENWAKILENLKNRKSNWDEQKNWAKLEQNLKNKDLAATLNSLESGQKILRKEREIILQNPNILAQNETLDNVDKNLEKIEKSLILLTDLKKSLVDNSIPDNERQEIEKIFDNNWPQIQSLELKIGQIETEAWVSNKAELAKLGKTLLKKYT